MLTNNGYSSSPAPSLRTVKVHGHSTHVRKGDVATLLGWVVAQLDASVEACTTLYGYRTIAENTRAHGVLDSNHLSATAVDYNGGRHPWEHGKALASGYTDTQVADLHAILAATGHTVQWGGDVSGRYKIGSRDWMHLEVRGTAKQVAAAARRLTGGTVKVTATVLNGRASPTTMAPVVHRRTTGYLLHYHGVVYRGGRVWLVTRFGTCYAAEYTTW